MSIVSLQQYQDKLGVGDTTDELVLYARMAAVTAMMAQECNRVFAKVVSKVETVSDNSTITIPFHGLEVGDEIRVTSSLGYDVLKTITAISLHTVTFDTATDPLDAPTLEDSTYSLTARPVITQSFPTKGARFLFLEPRPVAEVRSVTINDEVLETTEYELSDVRRGISVTGQLDLVNRCLPRHRDGGYMPNGVTISHVAGEPRPPVELQEAALTLLKLLPTRQESSGLQAESFEYWSKTMKTAPEIGALFGDADFVLKRWRLPIY